MSLWDSLVGFFAELFSQPVIIVVLSVTVASCVVIAVVVFNSRRLERKIQDVTESRFFSLVLKTYYLGYDANRDTLLVSLLATKTRKRVDIGVAKFFSKTASQGKELVLSALRIQLTDSNIQFSDEGELQDIIVEVGKWCDRIIRVEIRPADLPKSLDQREGLPDYSTVVNSPKQAQG